MPPPTQGLVLGSASLVTNASGGVVSQSRYTPYGSARHVSGTWPTDRRFTGQRLEGSVGLYDYNARYYSPLLARFISPDSIVPRPEDPQSFNRYAYARNSPLVRVDPSGHQDCKADAAACLFGSPSNKSNKSKPDGLAQKLQEQHTRRNTPGWLKDVLPSFSLDASSLTQWGYVSPQQGFKITVTLEGEGIGQARDWRMNVSIEHGRKLKVDGIGFTLGGVEYSVGGAGAAGIEVLLPLSGAIKIGDQEYQQTVSAGYDIFEPERRAARYHGVAQSGTLPMDSPLYQLSVKVDVKIFDLSGPIAQTSKQERPTTTVPALPLK